MADPTNAADAISRLRLVVARVIDCSEPGDELAAWFADCVKRYVDGAIYGLTLEQAFRLELTAGERPWWRVAERVHRNALIHQLASRHFPGLPVRAQARGIRRRRDLMQQLPVPLSESTLRRILAHPSPPFPEPDPAERSPP